MVTGKPFWQCRYKNIQQQKITKEYKVVLNHRQKSWLNTDWTVDINIRRIYYIKSKLIAFHESECLECCLYE